VRQRELPEAVFKALGHLEPACPTVKQAEMCLYPPPAGHRMVVAEDGQAALELWTKGGA